MKRLERLGLWLLLGYGFCGCTRTSEIKAESHEALRSDTRVVETVQQGPETITTTVEEWAADPQAVQERPKGAGVAPIGAPMPDHQNSQNSTQAAVTTANNVISNGAPVLVRRTVTVDQRGPVATRVEAAADVTATAVVQTDTKRATKWFPGWGWYALLALALAGAGAYVAWRAKVFTL